MTILRGLAKNLLFFFSFWVIRLIFGKMGSAWVKVGVSFHTLLNRP